MPRRSAASLSVIELDPSASRLRPPASLSDAERAVFLDLVTACDANHFRTSDRPWLVRYCEAIALADLAAENLRKEGPVIFGKPSAWLTVQSQALKSIIALSIAAQAKSAKPFARQDRGAGEDTASGRAVGGEVLAMPQDPLSKK